jgi:hypothetical protein
MVVTKSRHQLLARCHLLDDLIHSIHPWYAPITKNKPGAWLAQSYLFRLYELALLQQHPAQALPDWLILAGWPAAQGDQQIWQVHQL